MATLKRHLTYSNLMATIAMFIALGGGAYALTLPKNSVGPRQLKNRAVTSKKLAPNAVTSRSVREFSLKLKDFERDELPSLVGSRAGSAPRTTGAAIRETTLTTTVTGKLFVYATLRDPFLTCKSNGSCSTQWGVYVDGRPVTDAVLRLQAAGGAGDGHPFDALYGTTSSDMRRGEHTIKLMRTDSSNIEDVGQFGAQLGAIGLG